MKVCILRSMELVWVLKKCMHIACIDFYIIQNILHLFLFYDFHTAQKFKKNISKTFEYIYISYLNN